MLGNQISLTNNVAKQVISVTATQNQTDFTVEGGYRINQLGVYRNGVRQVDGRDYIARNGSTVTLVSQGANAGDAMEFVVFDDFRVADALSVNTGGTINASVNITGALQMGTGTSIFSPANNVLTLGTNSNERLRINSAGQVGIGTDTPTVKLEVVDSHVNRTWSPTSQTELLVERNGNCFISAIGSTISNCILNFGDSDDENVGAIDYDHADDSMGFRVNGAEKFLISSTGRITQQSNNEDIDMDANASGQLKLDGNGYNVGLALNAEGLNIYTNSSSRGIIFGTNETERVRVTGAGRVGINSTAPTSSLDIRGTTLAGGILIEDSSASSAAPGIEIIGKRSDANSSQSFAGRLMLAKNYTGGSITANQHLGTVGFGGNHTDGSKDNILYSASISAVAESTFDANLDMPTALLFKTGTTGRDPDTANVAIGTERMRLTSDGKLLVGKLTHTGDALFVVETEHASGGIIGEFDNNNSGNFGGVRILGGVTDRECRFQSLYGNSFFTFYTEGSGAATERMRITEDGNVGVNVTPGGRLAVSTSDNQYALRIDQDHASAIFQFVEVGSASYVGDGLKMHYTRAGNSAFNFMACDANHGGSADREFTFRGDGEAFADGSFNNNGADYAEFFESSTGAAIPVGTTVVLENNKVRAATSEDSASSIMGVVRPKGPGKASMIIGNTAWNKWSGKYLSDDFDQFILDEHLVYEWTETVEDGDDIFHSYESHQIPEGVTIPSDVVGQTHDSEGNRFVHYRLNPDFDPSVTYVPRQERDEWIIVGLIGQVRILDGQPMNDRWVKMRDVSDSVEEWFIR